MKQLFLLFLFSLCTMVFLPKAALWAQEDDVVEELIADAPGSSPVELFQEKIFRISRSKKIFILSNSNQKLNMGDFISLLMNDELVSRALVAKVTNDTVAIKMLKIYSMKLWGNLGPNTDVQILVGDDSYYLNAKLNAQKENQEAATDLDDKNAILTEEDLFSTKDELNLDENNNRKIKTDNILGVSYGQISATDVDGETSRFAQLSAHWSYQVVTNVWGEFLYGHTSLNSYPSEDLDTTLTSYTIRGKYIFNAPFYSYILPYVGYQIRRADSPDAGTPKATTTTGGDSETQAREEAEMKREVSMVNDLEKNTIIFGVTVLKRLVPGWFVKADIGTDIINVGFTIEF